MTIRSFLLGTLALGSLTAIDANAQSVANEVTIEFGQLVVGGTGTVTVPSSSDTRTATGSVALVGSAFIQRGRFDITFTPGAQVMITAPPSVSMGGANTPTLAPTIEGGSIQTIPVGGVLTVYVGGTITYTTFGAFGSNSAVVSILVTPL
jgi:Domain of unknown function (DUF4402)